MLSFEVNPSHRYLELGGGGNPALKPECQGGNSVNVDVRMCHDSAGNQAVDVVADFNQDLPLGSEHFDGVLSVYCLEHIDFRRVSPLLREVRRVVKPGGKVAFVIPNTRAQFQWALANPGGWDGKDFFTSASEVIFGSQDYRENAHRSYFDPETASALFRDAGFEGVMVSSHGPRDTDMVVEAVRPRERTGEAAAVDARKAAVGSGQVTLSQLGLEEEVKEMTRSMEQSQPAPAPASTDPAELYDRHYFNGGQKVGGYAREGYWDFPVHEVMVQNLMMRRPQSVLEVGAARGYLGKRLLDRGVPYWGLEVSKHCYLSRVCEKVFLHDICQTPWPVGDKAFDVSFSVSVLEHIPHQHLSAVLREFGRACKRHIHAIDFGEGDDGFDKTHQPFATRDEWRTRFSNAGLTDYEIMSNKDITRGDFPADVLNGDGKVKLNLGSFTVMHHHGWVNVDQHDLAGYAQANGYKYLRHDLRTSLPHGTGTVDLVYSSHALEHLTNREGLVLLKEIRRVLKPHSGGLRVLVPDAELLTGKYRDKALGEFDEISDGCAGSPTQVGKLWSLLHSGHNSMYDEESLVAALKAAGFVPQRTSLHRAAFEYTKQIVRETHDQFACLSLIVDAIPLVG